MTEVKGPKCLDLEFVTIFFLKPEDAQRENQRLVGRVRVHHPDSFQVLLIFPPWEEVLHDLNGRSWLPKFWQVAECRSEFKFSVVQQKKKLLYLYLCGAPAFVGVFVICPSLMLGWARHPKHKPAIYFPLYYAGVCVCLIMAFNKCHCHCRCHWLALALLGIICNISISISIC